MKTVVGRSEESPGSCGRLVREAVLNAIPAERKIPVREQPTLEPAKAFVEVILEADRKAPRKQRGADAYRQQMRLPSAVSWVSTAWSRLMHALAIVQLLQWRAGRSSRRRVAILPETTRSVTQRLPLAHSRDR
jgi:hypothetical protein